jgi:hypothetical protein
VKRVLTEVAAHGVTVLVSAGVASADASQTPRPPDRSGSRDEPKGVI